jgi:DNA polymerase-1
MELEMVLDQEVADLFEEYEFGSLKKYLGDIKPQPRKEQNRLISTKADAREVCKAATQTKKCAILVKAEHEGIFSPVNRIYMATDMDGEILVAEGDAESFRTLLEDPETIKYGYDLKFQRNILKHNGIELNGKYMDIELMHYLINPEKSHKLDILCRSYLDITLEEEGEEEMQAESLSLFDDEPQEKDHTELHLKEVAAMCLLGTKVWEEMETLSLCDLYNTMEEPLISILSDLEMEGVKIDLAQLRKYSYDLASELNEIQARIRDMAQEPDLNIMSPKQIGVLLFEKLKVDPKIKPKSNVRYSYPTDEETLSALAERHPIINEILEYRGVKKLLSTYIEPLPSFVSPVTGKIHTTFNQSLTATGRLSSSKPNLQNIPIRTERGKEIRKAFVPSTPDGFIVSADYSQIELRIMAHLSCDTHLIEAFRKGQDVHAMTAAKIFGISPDEVTSDQRRIAKTANFGIMYGISSFGLAQRLKIGRAEAKKIIEDYFANFPAISSFIEDTLAVTRENGYVETIFGRRRYLPDINSKNGTVRSLAERNAVNAPIQGTAADIIKLAMINVDRRIAKEGLKSRMILQIHDELVFDAAADEVEKLEAIVKEEMENVTRLSIPLTVECNHGKNWLEAH